MTITKLARVVVSPATDCSRVEKCARMDYSGRNLDNVATNIDEPYRGRHFVIPDVVRVSIAELTICAFAPTPHGSSVQ
jgi:hypothetical protein